eukprot:2464573-Alexandrium_andersonii.AAC.1
MAGMCPCITSSRAGSRSYYSTRLQRCLRMSELSRLQGMPWGYLNLDGVSERQTLIMAGNAMSLNVMLPLVRAALKAVGLLE